jgi:hypothetical protein
MVLFCVAVPTGLPLGRSRHKYQPVLQPPAGVAFKVVVLPEHKVVTVAVAVALNGVLFTVVLLDTNWHPDTVTLQV